MRSELRAKSIKEMGGDITNSYLQLFKVNTLKGKQYIFNGFILVQYLTFQILKT